MDARLHLLALVEVFLFFLSGATLQTIGNPGNGSDIDIAMGTVGVKVFNRLIVVDLASALGSSMHCI